MGDSVIAYLGIFLIGIIIGAVLSFGASGRSISGTLGSGELLPLRSENVLISEFCRSRGYDMGEYQDMQDTLIITCRIVGE